MPTYRFEFEQYSPEYWEAHRGHPSASNFKRIIQPAKCLMSAGAEPYALELAAEIIDQRPNFFTDKPETVHMRNGINNEPNARRWYEYETGHDAKTCGLVVADDGILCCSPDGIVGEDGGVEIKCPELKKHLEYLLAGGLPDEYKPQVHGSLIITGRKWWDFVSYHPGTHKQLLVRVTPDDFTEKLRACLDKFLILYNEIIGKVRAL